MSIRVVAVACLACLASVVEATAQTDFFWDGSSGNYSDVGRWFPLTGPPGNLDRALFQSGTTFTVTGGGTPLQAVVAVNDVTFAGAIAPTGSSTSSSLEVGLTSLGQATFLGSGASLTAGTAVTVGNASTGTLIFAGGATGSSQGMVGAAAVNLGLNGSGNGTMTITGMDSEFTSTGSFDLGGIGTGEVNVEDMAHLDTNGSLALGQAGLNMAVAFGSHGTLNISGDATVHNELQTNLGLGGHGILNISSGSFTTTDGGTANPALSIARFTNSEGELNVSGTGQVTTEGEIIVGGGGNGSMTITDQGVVQSNVTVGLPALVGFGASATGTVTIDGPDTAWNVTDALIIGESGDATVDILNGGTLFLEDTVGGGDPYLFIGYQNNSDGELNVSSASQVTAQGRLVVGGNGYGTMTITDAGVVDSTVTTLLPASVGQGNNGWGTVTIEDSGSIWNITDALIVAENGFGEVDLYNGGTLYVEDTGGGGDPYIRVGDKANSSGHIHVRDATSFLDASFIPVTLGTEESSSGSLSIEDGGEAFIQYTTVGQSGYGELYVYTNSVLTTGTAVLAQGDTGEAYADVADGSSWDVLGQLIIGQGGYAEAYLYDATLSVDEFIVLGDLENSYGMLSVDTSSVGGTLTSLTVGNLGEGELGLYGPSTFDVNGPTDLAIESTGTALLTVGFDSSYTTADTLTVGDEGDATFDVIGEAQTGTTFIAKTAGASSAYVSGGTWTINNAGPASGSLFVGGSDTTAGGAGTITVLGTLDVNNLLKVYGGSVVTLNSGTIHAAQVDVLGRIDGFGTIDAPTTNVEGTIAPSTLFLDTGRLVFDGDLTLFSMSELDVDLDGLIEQSEFDVVDVLGNAMLDGALNVSLVGGFTLELGQSFEIMDIVGTRSGTFSGLGEGALVGNFGGIDLFISYLGGNGNDVVLFTLAAGLPGDGNGDGWVDGLDYLLWASHYGTHPGPDGDITDGDYNDDGSVDGLDYLLWAGNYGSHAALSVPEPCSLAILVSAAGLLGQRRRTERPARRGREVRPRRVLAPRSSDTVPGSPPGLSARGAI
ncbi:MAG: hypothetical protein KDA63_13965 [Planctomycetales bacterium]|nr:hypothetical protein [Planctomycetales bacterium]